MKLRTGNWLPKSNDEGVLQQAELWSSDAPSSDMRESGWAQASQRTISALFILDKNLHVVLHYEGSDCSDPSNLGSRMIEEGSQKLLPALDEQVRGMVRHQGMWGSRRIVALPPTYMVAAFPISGKLGNWIGVSVQRLRIRNNLARAADRFSLTRRELDVLTLVLDGASSAEIAKHLHIAETTVQGYFKQLLSKTQSHSRAVMVAKVLDWESRRSPSGRRRAL